MEFFILRYTLSIDMDHSIEQAILTVQYSTYSNYGARALHMLITCTYVHAMSLLSILAGATYVHASSFSFERLWQAAHQLWLLNNDYPRFRYQRVDSGSRLMTQNEKYVL